VFINRIANYDSQWHGVAGPRRWSRLDGLVQVGGTVWQHGGVDGRPGKGFCFVLTPSRWLAVRGGGKHWSLRTRRFL
jgi:hypothetical protein